jgi:hypothetical protein
MAASENPEKEQGGNTFMMALMRGIFLCFLQFPTMSEAQLY